MTKTPEEKAREEAKTMISEYANNSHISREYYAEGYLSGYHSRDEEVKELREALKECIQGYEEARFYFETQNDIEQHEAFQEAIIKAKQLLK